MVVENARENDSRLPPPSLMTSVKVGYQQGEENQCLLKTTASALHYCGLEEVVSHFSNTAPTTVQYLPHQKAMQSLWEMMIKHAPKIGLDSVCV